MSSDAPFAQFDNAITNIRETTKWILSAIAGILGLALGGLQFGGLGVSDWRNVNPVVWTALGLLLVVVLLAVGYALSILVYNGGTFTAFTDYANKQFRSARYYIDRNATAADPSKGTYLQELAQNYAWAQTEVAAGRVPPNDPTVTAIQFQVELALHVAAWRVTLERFSRLKLLLLVLVPVAMGCAVVLAANAKGNDKANNHVEARNFAASPADRDLLGRSGWSKECTQNQKLQFIVTEKPAPAEAGMLLSASGCKPLRVLTQEGHILSILD